MAFLASVGLGALTTEAAVIGAGVVAIWATDAEDTTVWLGGFDVL